MSGITGSEVAMVRAAADFLEKAYQRGWLDRLIDVFRKEHNVLVLGATGTGKTAFIQSLTKASAQAIDLMDRTEFVERSRVKIANRLLVFTDVPGPDYHYSKRKEVYIETMRTKGGIAGIINLVAYGYHETQAVKAPEIEVDGSVSETFLAQQRASEIEALKEWTPILTGDIARCMITVVNKADLWWNRRDEVLDYYKTGDYYRALGEAQRLKPVVLEYNSVFQKFYGQARMTGDFQDSDRIGRKRR